jgi:hypothetical protein
VTMYITKGSVRGVGTKHRTLKGALLRDQARCAKVGGYSDRYIHREDGLELDSSEQKELDSLERKAQHANR